MTTSISYLIVEDIPLDELMLRSLLQSYPYLRHIASATGANDAATMIASTHPDLVFLDIDMPDGNGIDILRKMKSLIPMAVFTTSHGEYALEGFELSAIDYLIKPITEERLKTTVKRIEEYYEMKNKASLYDVMFEKEIITIKEGYTKIQLLLSDIRYLEAMQDYTKVVTAHKKYMVNMPLSNFMAQLPEDKFIRLHRSYAVLKNNIKELRPREVVCKDVTLPIGRTYRETVAKIQF